MDYKFLLLLLAVIGLSSICKAQHEDIPYQDVTKICETCICLSGQDVDKRFHHVLSCAMKNFKHILARWPDEFGENHNDIEIVATFSGNTIPILQQLPATNATLTFSCRHCGIKEFQVPTFMDTPNIERLDLSWNDINTDILTPDLFRGPYRDLHYEPIGLSDLDLSHNQLHSLDKKIFEHIPHLKRLNLSNNKITLLDNRTTMALASATALESLDLSNTGISTISATILKALINLVTLNLAGNEFSLLPDDFHLLGMRLNQLNLAGNKFVRFSEQNFMGLKALTHLNISDMPELKVVAKNTFTRLETLEYLYCTHNHKLYEFDLNGLMHASNLTHLDISSCSISTLTLDIDLSQTLLPPPSSNDTSTNTTTTVHPPKPWPKLRTFETVDNPWQCDCQLLQVLEFAGGHHQHKDTETRCETPYIFAGARLSNMTAQQICAMKIPKKYEVINEDPPRFLRKRYIILTLIIASVVIVIGLIIGFCVACIRRRLRRADFGVEPIRYTSVRSSNLSAFAHVNPGAANGVNSNA